MTIGVNRNRPRLVPPTTSAYSSPNTPPTHNTHNQDANGRFRNPYDAGCARNCLSRLVYAEAPAAHPDAATNGVNGGGGSGGFFGRGSARRRGGGVFESLHGRMGASPLGTVDEGDEEEGLLTVV